MRARIWALLLPALWACGDTVSDGVYTCTAPGRGTDCPEGWYCRTDPAHPAELRCHAGEGAPSEPGAAGTVCDAPTECDTGRCSNGHCVPEGFAWIDPGTFYMGSPVYEPRRQGDEEIHRVTISRPFLIGTTEVTQGQWLALLPGGNPSYFAECGQDCPVERVNLYEALELANARSSAEGLTPCYTLAGCTGTVGSGCPSDGPNMGRNCSEVDNPDEVYQCTNVTLVGLDCDGYRLPTEAEWEYAARAGSSSAYPGVIVSPDEECDPDLDRIAWQRCNSDMRTHPVAALEPNLWGLHDTAGNAQEQVWDEYVPFGSLTGAVTDPLGARELVASRNGTSKGGSFAAGPAECRSAFRGHNGSQLRGSSVGFRLARTMRSGGDR